MTLIKYSMFVIAIFNFMYVAAPSAHGQQETDDFAARYFQMLGGIAVGFIGHEAAHYAAGAGKVEFGAERPIPNWSCDTCSRSHTRFVALAGFIEQGIATEVILRSQALPRRGPSFLHGLLLFNIALPIVYVGMNEASDSVASEGMGDLKAFSRAERRAIEATLLTWSAWSAYRWYAAAERKSSRSSSLLVAPHPDGGIALFYATKF